MAVIKDSDFFGLPRPQYAATAEMLVSALLWGLTGENKPELSETFPGGGSEDGIVFRKTEKAKGSKKNIAETFPSAGSPRSDELLQVIEAAFGLVDESSLQRAMEILGDDLVGNVPAKANSKAVVPMTITAALMQDTRGMMGVNNPPNFSRILKRMFALGQGTEDPAKLLAKVLSNSTPLVSGDWLEKSINAMAPDEIKEYSQKVADSYQGDLSGAEILPAWLDGSTTTPFHWFAKAWKNLMDGGWIEVMPRRRWVDWVSCVLRTAIGSGYIFEMNFYYQLVLSLANEDEPTDVKAKALSSNGAFFYWDASASISTRDVASKIRKTCERGTACRTVIQEWTENDLYTDFPAPGDFSSSVTGLEEWVSKAREWYKKNATADNGALKKQVVDAISGKANRAANNVYETINYALQDRGSALEEDLYSLMKKRGNRYTVVQPGQEWFVVVASLTARRAGELSRVANLVEALDSIGIEASYKTITLELERVGLGRTSHDADDAIEIAAAF